MVRAIFTNNATSTQSIIDETKSVKDVAQELGFEFAGNGMMINGIPITMNDLEQPVEEFMVPGVETVRITSIPKRSNA